MLSFFFCHEYAWLCVGFAEFHSFFIEIFVFSWPLRKYSWISHHMRTNCATSTALCYPMLTLLVRKQMDSPYESFHQRPLTYLQAIFLVYVKGNFSKGDVLPLFLFFSSIWATTAGKLRIRTSSHRAVLVRLLLLSSLVQATMIRCHSEMTAKKKNNNKRTYQKSNNLLLTCISENIVVYLFKYTTRVEQMTKSFSFLPL